MPARLEVAITYQFITTLRFDTCLPLHVTGPDPSRRANSLELRLSIITKVSNKNLIHAVRGKSSIDLDPLCIARMCFFGLAENHTAYSQSQICN
jgi:hypothetical protein